MKKETQSAMMPGIVLLLLEEAVAAMLPAIVGAIVGAT